jgi:hypothetical protein
MIEPRSEIRVQFLPLRGSCDTLGGISALVIDVKDDTAKRLVEIPQTSHVWQLLSGASGGNPMSKVDDFFLVTVADPLTVELACMGADGGLKGFEFQGKPQGL